MSYLISCVHFGLGGLGPDLMPAMAFLPMSFEVMSYKLYTNIMALMPVAYAPDLVPSNDIASDVFPFIFHPHVFISFTCIYSHIYM